MSLLVFTARRPLADPDALDVTRAFADAYLATHRRPSPGAPFAPSWTILRPYKRSPRTAACWARYVGAYHAEMLRSYRIDRASWDALLARDRVVLTCYCQNPDRCHRRLLAGYLGALGATVCSELPTPGATDHD